MGRIRAQIDDHLMNLHRIGHDRRYIVLKIGREADGRRQGGLKEVHGLFDDGPHLDGQLGGGPLTTEGQNLGHHAFGAVAGLFDAGQFFMSRRVVFGNIDPGQLGVTQNRHQNIIEIMGDSARQHADGFHFLGLGQTGFQGLLFDLGFFSLGDIPGHANHPQGMGPIV